VPQSDYIIFAPDGVDDKILGPYSKAKSEN